MDGGKIFCEFFPNFVQFFLNQHTGLHKSLTCVFSPGLYFAEILCAYFVGLANL